MYEDRFAYWKHTQLILNVISRGSYSPETVLGVLFYSDLKFSKALFSLYLDSIMNGFMRKLAGFFFFLSSLHVSGQAPDSSDKASQVLEDSLVSIYYSSQQQGVSSLYNGRQFYGYLGSIEGDAFYLSKNWHTGSIFYDGLWYRNVQIMYDIYRDEVIIKHPNGVAVVLFGERVNEFSFGGQTFVYLNGNENSSIKKGFYQRLTQGRAIVYAKRIKLLEEKIDGLIVERKFIPRNVFFIYKEGSYYPVKKMQALLNALEDKRNEVQQYRNRLNLRYKTNVEQVIVSVTTYYNQLYR
jgi:hypothetical protein